MIINLDNNTFQWGDLISQEYPIDNFRFLSEYSFINSVIFQSSEYFKVNLALIITKTDFTLYFENKFVVRISIIYPDKLLKFFKDYIKENFNLA